MCGLIGVMKCVTTPTFSICINGKAYCKICPTRGIRQGDSLLPYLFLLCVEGFSYLLAKVERERQIHGVSIYRRAPSISHLLFADDSLLFCKANLEELQVISDVLQTYAVASGQCINFEKSSVFFSTNTMGEQRERIKEVLRIREVVCFESYLFSFSFLFDVKDRNFESYLGLPAMVGRLKYQMFAYLKERVWKKMQGWKGLLLSRAGKEVLIKAMAQAFPSYTMGVFQLPVKLCNDLNAMYVRFWWG